MKVTLNFKVSRFWFAYFLIRLFYYFFTLFVFKKVANVFDTNGYLSGEFTLSKKTFLVSTEFMNLVGGVVSKILFVDVLTNLPFMLFSFFTIVYVVDKLEIRKYVNNWVLLILISTPNFCIWTSMCSKEVFGLFYNSIFAIVIVNFLNGNTKIKLVYILASYFCLLFKPQYFIFIFQVLVFLFIVKRGKLNVYSTLILGLIIVIANVSIIYAYRDTIDGLSKKMYWLFNVDKITRTTRENIFVNKYDFFYHAPYGMFIGFFGPTFDEMFSRPMLLLAGVESIIILVLFAYLSYGFMSRFLFQFKFNPKVFYLYLVVFLGILLVHYPFGVFNPGSATRYRCNFYFLFLLLMFELNIIYKTYHYSNDTTSNLSS